MFPNAVMILALLVFIQPVQRPEKKAAALQEPEKVQPNVPIRGEAPATNSKGPATWNVTLSDDSVVKAAVVDSAMELVTPFGTLNIPVKDIHRIELGFRLSAEMEQQISNAISDLGNSDFKTRQKASSDLLALKEKAYPALKKASKSGDAEVVRRADQLMDRIRESIGEDRLEFKDHDVVVTADSRIAGKLSARTIKIKTLGFGEQALQLTDVRAIRSPLAPEEVVNVPDALPDPGALLQYANQVGKSFVFRVTGASRMGPVYGTDVYTVDSTLNQAAVHAGILKPGQTGFVKVTMVGLFGAYPASTKNGISSSDWNGAYPGYRISKVTKAE